VLRRPVESAQIAEQKDGGADDDAAKKKALFVAARLPARAEIHNSLRDKPSDSAPLSKN
jgi:hypothetical protein